MRMDLHHIALWVSSGERSLRFYEALGFTTLRREERVERNDTILWMTNGSVVLELFVQGQHPTHISDPEAYGLRHIAFHCPDVSTLWNTLKEAGYSPEPIRKDTYTGESMFFIKDPDGQPIEIHE